MDSLEEAVFLKKLEDGIKKAKAQAWDEAVTVLYLGDKVNSEVLSVMTKMNPYRG